MVSMLSEEGRAKAGVYEYVIDTVDELSDVPTDVHVGSVVYCIENSKKYMLNNSGTYVEVNFKKGGSGGEAKLGTKEINENGIYQASDFDLDGWSEVGVSVSVGVFPSGTSSITSNGIYDITSFASVDVNVSGGGGSDAEDALVMRTISGSYYNGRVTGVGEYAFQNCISLTTVSFPNVTSIGYSAFQGCFRLTTVSFPNTTSIGSNAFYKCTSLTTANFPNATSIGSSAFYGCSRLTTASFSNTTNIGNYAFYSCSSLTTVSFPSATSIGNNAFQNCISLTTVSFPNVISIGSGVFCNCISLTTVSFPNTTSIGSNAFYSCDGLTTVSFPNATNIGSYAFQNCKKLAEIYFMASSVVSLSNVNAFNTTPMSNSTYTGAFGSIYVPASLVDTYKVASNWSAYADRITSYVE